MRIKAKSPASLLMILDMIGFLGFLSQSWSMDPQLITDRFISPLFIWQSNKKIIDKIRQVEKNNFHGREAGFLVHKAKKMRRKSMMEIRRGNREENKSKMNQYRRSKFSFRRTM